jgi:Na+-driven multidrug efflux pump
MAALPLAVHMATLPIKGWSMVSMAPIRASGDTRFSMFVGILCSALVIPFAWLGIERLHIGLYSVPFGWIAAWSARALITYVKLRGGAWTRRETLAA